MNQVSQLYDNCDLTIIAKKTEVVHQPEPGDPSNKQTATIVKEQKLNVVVIYILGSFSKAVHTDDEVSARIANMWHLGDSVLISGC